MSSPKTFDVPQEECPEHVGCYCCSDDGEADDCDEESPCVCCRESAEVLKDVQFDIDCAQGRH